MFINYRSKRHVPSQILIFVALLCWLCLPISARGEVGHKHEETKKVESEQHENIDGSEQLGDQANEHDHEEHQDVVHLSDAEMEEFGIEIDVAGPGKLRLEIAVPGEVVVNYDRLAHIGPRFPGVVTEVRKHIGDYVRRGEVLAVIESNEGLVPYQMKSFINGTVIEKHMTLGEVHSEDVDAFVIADLDTVWINLSIYQMHLPKVAVGQKVVISAGQGVPDANGVVSYISPSVDEHTRTATARVVLSNRGGQWRPGLFVEGRITIKEIEAAVLVPKSALQTMDGRTVVFVDEHEDFLAQPVEIGRSNEAWAEVLSGLESGQEYVCKGGFVLKAELLKGAFVDEHGH
ncbi:MAG: efflux RND transporter periplasmic adaptor subunit [Deltaproteobacteria bacterium]|nr:MAG: efflux RND transporter periplasmic adaptor subunit [Deltaproteobacteria bacterium]